MCLPFHNTNILLITPSPPFTPREWTDATTYCDRGAARRPPTHSGHAPHGGPGRCGSVSPRHDKQTHGNGPRNDDRRWRDGDRVKQHRRLRRRLPAPSPLPRSSRLHLRPRRKNTQRNAFRYSLLLLPATQQQRRRRQRRLTKHPTAMRAPARLTKTQHRVLAAPQPYARHDL